MAEELVKREREAWGIEQIERAADYVVKSRLFGVQTKEEAVALMLIAQAEGIHPMRAVQEYHIINGRPALRADAMLSRFLLAGGRVEWHEISDTRVEATFSHPQGGTARIAWTLEDAKRAGLLNKPGGNWSKYPRAMLRARVISEGVRTVYPPIVVNLYTPEEVIFFDDGGPQATGEGVAQVQVKAPPQQAQARQAPKKEEEEVIEVSATPVPKAPGGAVDAAPSQQADLDTRREINDLIMRTLNIKPEDLKNPEAMKEVRSLVSFLLTDIVGRTVESTAQLTQEEAVRVLQVLREEASTASASAKQEV